MPSAVDAAMAELAAVPTDLLHEMTSAAADASRGSSKAS